MDDRINSPAPFNDPGELFNYDTPPAPRRYLRPIKEDSPPLDPSSASVPRVRRSLFNDPAPVDVVPAPPVRYRTLVGNFSAIRAAQVARQHAIGFWSPDAGVLQELAKSLNSRPAALTSAEVSAAYNDLLLFSYLPEALTPTLDEFTRLVQSVNLDGYLTDVGVVQPKDVVDVEDPAPDVTLTPGSFAESLNGFCHD